jgi:hypothetical protein
MAGSPKNNGSVPMVAGMAPEIRPAGCFPGAPDFNSRSRLARFAALVYPEIPPKNNWDGDGWMRQWERGDAEQNCDDAWQCTSTKVAEAWPT